MSLQGKVVMITGVTRGFGRALATCLLARADRLPPLTEYRYLPGWRLVRGLARLMWLKRTRRGGTVDELPRTRLFQPPD